MSVFEFTAETDCKRADVFLSEKTGETRSRIKKLADENAVVAARKAYDAISSLEQQALVTNISKLTSAESVIKYLRQRENPNPTPDDPKPTPNEGCNSAINGGAYVAIFALVTGIAVVKAVYVYKNKKKKSNG